jgi:hypothetical protein
LGSEIDVLDMKCGAAAGRFVDQPNERRSDQLWLDSGQGTYFNANVFDRRARIVAEHSRDLGEK